jgi:hypothetical protein
MFTVDFGPSQANVEAIAGGLNRWSGDIRTTTGLMERIRDAVGIPAVRSNFQSSGGRIGGWAPLQDATFRMPRRAGRFGRANYGSGPPLMVRNVLYSSATAKSRWSIQGPNLLVPASTFQGSNAIYGRLQHEGGTSPLTGSSVPGRPFFRFNQEDVVRATQIVDQWVAENFNKRIGVKAAATTVGSVTS